MDNQHNLFSRMQIPPSRLKHRNDMTHAMAEVMISQWMFIQSLCYGHHIGKILNCLIHFSICTPFQGYPTFLYSGDCSNVRRSHC